MVENGASISLLSVLFAVGFATTSFLHTSDLRAQTQPAGVGVPGVGVQGLRNFGVPSSRNLIGLRVVGGFSDNIRRQTTMQESGDYLAAGVVVDFARDGPRISTDFLADIEYRSYSVDDIEDETYGILDASMDIQLLPDRIFWYVGDSFGQGRTNALQVENPLNREEINLFSTGPRVIFPIGQRTDLEVAATASRQSFEETTVLDNDTVSLDVALMRAIGDRSNLGLSLSRREIEYELATLGNDIDNLYITFDRQFARGSASISAGVSRYQSGSSDNSAPFFQLTLGREIGVRSQLTLFASSSFIDGTEAFRNSGIGNIVSERLDDVFLTADVYEQRSVGLLYTLTGARTSFSVNGSLLRDRFQSSTSFDNEQRRIDVQLQRELRRQLNAGVNAYVSNRTYQSSARLEDDTGYGIWLRKNFGARFRLELALQNYTRDIGIDDLIEETTARLSFQYDIVSR